MERKLDLKDWKILNQLDLNCHQSEGEIGKKARISKQVVNYRIKRLIKDGIINSFYPHINISKLGYNAHKVYLRFKSLSKTKEEEIWNYLIKCSEIVWVASCSGRWDLIFAIASKNIEEFNNALTNFMNKYSTNISERAISVFNKATLHHRKWLTNKTQEDIKWFLGGKIEEQKIDTKDRIILQELEKTARESIVNIATKAKISASLAVQRIKKLEKKGIIGGYRLALNRELLGIHYCKAFIYYQNKTTTEESKIISYCENLKNILGVSQSIGPWDLELEFEVHTYNEFHNIMKELKNKFEIISNFETCYIEKECGLSFIPKRFHSEA